MHKILIVDDRPENIQLIARILESSFPSARLYQAIGGDSALKVIGQISLDLVVSDWDMPGMNGIDLIRSMKEDPKTAHIPVVIVTAIMLTAKDLEMALLAGAHDYLRKPVDPQELTARVTAALTLSGCHLNEIREKDLQLMEKTLIHVKNNEFDINMTRDLEKLLEQCSSIPEVQAAIRTLIGKMEQKIREDSWQGFEVAFQNIHSDFIKNLLQSHPGLTKSELKLCILLKLGMNTKDIASMLYLSPESLKVSRSRLRTKLGMQECDSFHTCLSSF